MAATTPPSSDTHRSSRAGTKWGRFAPFNQHCPTTTDTMLLPLLQLAQVKEKSPLSAFSAGLSLCLKNFCFPSFRMICVPRLHSLPYFPWWIYHTMCTSFPFLLTIDSSSPSVGVVLKDIGICMVRPDDKAPKAQGLWKLESATSGFPIQDSHLLTK